MPVGIEFDNAGVRWGSTQSGSIRDGLRVGTRTSKGRTKTPTKRRRHLSTSRVPRACRILRRNRIKKVPT